MLMNRLTAQQDFLPTDLVTEASVWYYVVSVPFILIGIWLMFAVSKNKRESAIKGGIGGGLFALGGVVLFVAVFGGDIPDTKQNYENLKANIQAVYAVDDVTLVDSHLESGARVKIVIDGITSEVTADWDPETYEPTLSPLTVEIKDLEAIKK